MAKLDLQQKKETYKKTFKQDTFSPVPVTSSQSLFHWTQVFPDTDCVLGRSWKRLTVVKKNHNEI